MNQGLRICVEKLHIRSREYIVAVYVGNFTRYVHVKRSRNPDELENLFQHVSRTLVSESQVKSSRQWVLDPDLDKKVFR